MLKAPISDKAQLALLGEFDQVLGLELLAGAEKLRQAQSAAAPAAEDAAEIEALIARRAEAKKAKDWAAADAIRDELKAMGIEIKDTPNGVEWKRI